MQTMRQVAEEEVPIDFNKIADYIGLDRLIEHVGVKRLIEKFGLDQFLASLSPAQRRELKRKLGRSRT
jgi:predicted regulator of amino acid metabolism with ACT domain